jgi:hypothetical protein
MIKNKNGSYNKFKLLIISLIFIIAISITGFYILENIELPKMETPSWIIPTPTPKPTLTLTPTPTPTSTPIDPRITALYNSTNVTYSNTTSWNWTYTNLSTNTNNWTYPPDMIGNYTFVAGGGQCYEIVKYEGGGGGQCFFENVGYGGAGGSSSNISYTVIAGGGGGAVGYTSVAHINSTPLPTLQSTPSQEVFVNTSQNVSQALIQIINPLGESSWLLYLIIIIPIVMMMSMIRGNSLSMLLPIIIGLVVFGYFFNIGSLPILVILGIIPMIIIMSSMLSDR